MIALVVPIIITTGWPWLVTTIFGSLAAACLVIPMWSGTCLLAEAFHTSGCHF